MNKFLRQLAAKNEAVNRAVHGRVRASRFGSFGLLVWSLASFAVTALFWFGAELKFFGPFLFLAALGAPSLVVMAVVDITRKQWAWTRLLALAVLLCAVALLVAKLYHLVHGATRD